ncbi:MAG: DNA-directed RNA polymerase subunit beta [Dehalococcoidales bacterium]|jgi:DNA-directed RNA polymerase subunit beta|nr:DNA-directed RNA polymerase subunit beta [Dehalococcoidales bacterium]MDD3264672.1 DNA-directed RNA polymerase subunit beta [Dehalococcoidales bacterium]MDD4322696.1 DNA-directed RNA polymerase subunit beta [Dehalococcoidales bacterium]MDD4794093.1 DNA-directed RNA polymerase subunit beta [Dehalococcoidales bacterium]MDD5498319.1 DNA-directed RNA polymerase subunit beta [Dehalococcoidales bacterium]
MVAELALSAEQQTNSRKVYSKLPRVLDVPNLVEVQLDSFTALMEKGVKDLLQEISPIYDFTGNRLELSFVSYEFREPRLNEAECYQRDQTYSVPLYVKARLLVKTTGEIKEPFDLFFGDVPLMTNKGTFITSGTERVIISQLIRSPGVYFMADEDLASGRLLCHANLIPSRGAWLEFDTSNRDVISVKIDNRRKLPVTTLLRAIGYSSDSEISELFEGEDNAEDRRYIQATIEKEPGVVDKNSALLDIYRKLRPGDPLNLDNAKKMIEDMFFNPQYYDLGIVGRYKVNQRLGLGRTENGENRALSREDLVEIVRRIIMVNNGTDRADDIDHLGNRRVRTVGELIQNQFRIGLVRLERVAKERMSIIAADVVTPTALINIRPVVSAVREFFSGSQLSQFMDQTNPLAEITHKRRLSAMGPGGLSRDRAGFDVRDVHYSHYGRICPIETPEGPNIGLIGSLATYGRINPYGFIETPYRKVYRELEPGDSRLYGRKVAEKITGKSDVVLAQAGDIITEDHVKAFKKAGLSAVKVVPFASNEIVYLTADEEEKNIVAQANTVIDELGQFTSGRIEARVEDRYVFVAPDKVHYMDVSTMQIFSVSTALIPFLEHNDANRALMGANMQRQAVPLLRPEAPLVATGMEKEIARNSGQVHFSPCNGVVASVTSSEIVIESDEGTVYHFPLLKFIRTNQGTCINQRPTVSKGQRVEKNQPLADSSSTDQGELALGQNVVCAFMSWRGYNYEDAIVLSDRLVEQDKFSSIHIFKHEVEARETKLGPEDITRDIPNVGEESLRELDEEGIIRIGAEVKPGDILVGKITPKGETELSAEEKLLRAIFGEKAREVKDTSLKVPHGEWGKVINVKVFSRDEGDDLPVRVNKWVQVWVAQKRKVSVGDKLAGRHGNKGVISIIAPREDMPILPDGTPVDIVLNPIGVPSRMNIGQILETHLGFAGRALGFKVLTPVFDGANEMAIEDSLAREWLVRRARATVYAKDGSINGYDRANLFSWLSEKGYDPEKVWSDDFPGVAKDASQKIWLSDQCIDYSSMNAEEIEKTIDDVAARTNIPSPTSGKVILRDGGNGEPFDMPVTVGSIYMLKLIHLVEDKVHARSTGPYSLISQQPLGGKAQFGGQRFGEMEVWALEAYGAAYNLQEMLTIKSDDVTGRTKTYESIIKGDDIMPPGVPESFKVLVKELQSLGLAVEVINQEERIIEADKVREIGEEAETEVIETPSFTYIEPTSVIESAGFTVDNNEEESSTDNGKEQE